MKFVLAPPARDAKSFYRVVLFDTTHRALFAVNSKRMKEEYFSLFNNSFIGIFKFRIRDYAFTLLNDKALEITQRDRGQLKISQLFYYPAEFTAFHESLISTRTVDNFEFRLNVPGEERHCSLSCKLFSYRGIADGIISDITDKRKHLLEIKNLNMELDNFLYHASHDMRAPISTILGLTNLIKTDTLHQNSLAYAQKIREQVCFMDNMLRDLSHIAFNNSQPVECAPVRIENVLDDILKPLKAEYPAVKCTTQIRVRKNLYSDPARVTTILNNIISNAFKYQRPEAEVQSVQIRVECLEDNCTIQVEDNGCGIERNFIDDIFKLFFKVNSRGKGSGLGLYVTQIMLLKLNGTIEVVSSVNSGTCFSFSIPNPGRQISPNKISI
jgi:signal transduction histidine kinase